MVFGAAAGAMARTGLSAMGKKARMSLAGSVLGNQGKVPGGAGKAAKDLSTIAKHWGKYFAEFIALKKLISTLAKASPALKQQLIVMNKSFLLFLRPIGDIMAKFVRPMALWMIKFATKWYQKFGTGGASNESKAAQEDLRAQYEVQKQIGQDIGDPQMVAAAEAGLAGLNTGGGEQQGLDLGAKFSETMKSMAEGLGGIFMPLTAIWDELKIASDNLWKDIIPESLKVLGESVRDMFSQLGDTLKAIWDLLKPLIAPMWELVKVLGGAALFAVVLVLTGAFKTLEILLLGLETTIKLVFVAFEWLWEGMKSLGNWIKEWDLLGAVKKVFNKATDWIKSLNPFKKDKKEGKAVGGLIRDTGMYQLHAGERVMTAGDTSRQKGGSANITNNINISATINNDLDIRQLARKLAEYSEGELRRRVSYI